MTVLLEAPLQTVALAVSEDGTITRRVQVAKTGRFWDPRYGRFAITRDEFAAWIRNFDALHARTANRMGMPVDIDHGPEKRGDTRAAGWVTQLDTLGADGKTATPDELWATVEWNTLGQELVGGKVYAYLSPSYQAQYRDETGKTFGTAMVGVGLTNRPLLRMATVTLDELDEAGIALERTAADPTGKPGADSPAAMNELLKRLRTALQLSDDASEDKILEAVVASVAKPAADPPTTKTLSELAKEEGCIVLTADAFADLQSQAAAGAGAAKTLAETQRDTAWDKALDDGKFTPAQKDSMFQLHEQNAELFFTMLDNAPAGVHMTPDGVSGSDAPAGVDPTLAAEAKQAGVALDKESAAIDAKIKTLQAEDRTLSYADAFDRVMAEVA